MDLGEELDKSGNEIFRFEALQEYFSDGSDVLQNEIEKQWREKNEIDMDLMKEWHEFIESKVKEGVKFSWVRLVKFPLNEYTKWSLYVYKKRVKYGIDIRIITKEKIEEFGVDIKDFYLIDEKNAFLMKYGKFNEYLDCEFDNKNLWRYKKIKDLLMAHSISVSDFDY